MFKNQDEKDSLKKSYYEYDRKLRKQRLKIGLCLAMAFSLFFAGLDFIYYPQEALKLFFVRLLVEAFLVVFFVFAYFDKIKNVKIAGIVWALSLFIFIDILIFMTQGATSPYYAGLNLTVVALSVVMPWSFKETLFICFCLLLFYLITILFHQGVTGIDYDVQTLISNVFFMVGTSIICVTASYFNARQRFKEFCLNYELEQNNKRLIALDEIKSRFFANISHEFRTPLTLITGPIHDVLKDYEHNTLDQMKPHLQMIKNNASRLMKLINNLLDVMRLDEKKYKINPQAMEVNGFVEGLVDCVSYGANLKEISMTKVVPDGQLYIEADFDAMEKVMLNILSNAIKFTANQGKINVEVKDNGDEVFIIVQDNGIGISEENLSYIFDRFKQVDDSHTRKHQGSGLGLALVKDLILLQKGKIEVESRLNEGSKFILKFPKMSPELVKDCHHNTYQIDQSEVYHSYEPSQNHAKDSITKGRHTILIVDDEPDMMHYIKNIFLNKNFNILCAKDGKEALEMIQQHNPHLVILDVMMPEIDGLSVCQMIKEDDKTKLIKVLMLTAKSDEESKILALQYGCDDFITKPFSSDEMIARVDNLLNASQLNRDLFYELEHTIKRLNIAQETLLKSDKLSAALDIPISTLQEIKHPLSYCIAALYSLKIDPLIMQDNNVSDAIFEIEESIHRINHIISDIRSFIMPKDCDIKKFPIREVVEESLAFISKAALENIEINVNISKDLQVIASRSHIGFVMVDLIRNAIRNIHQSNRNGIITILVKSEPSGRAIIGVIDNGLEINKEDLEVIFKPFFDFSTLQKGLDMGLNTSYLIIKAHHSELKATSDFHKGNEMSFVLPIW